MSLVRLDMSRSLSLIGAMQQRSVSVGVMGLDTQRGARVVGRLGRSIYEIAWKPQARGIRYAHFSCEGRLLIVFLWRAAYLLPYFRTKLQPFYRHPTRLSWNSGMEDGNISESSAQPGKATMDEVHIGQEYTTSSLGSSLARAMRLMHYVAAKQQV